MLQTLAIIAMGFTLTFTSRPAVAAAARLCTNYCADNCTYDCWPCMTMGCNFETCLGVDGYYRPFVIICY